MEQDKVVPIEGPGDFAYNLTKGVLGSLPIAGSIMSETFGLMVNQPIKKRMENWLQNLYEDIEKLKEKSTAYEPENLEKNEQFISTVQTAAQMAIRTHSEAKLVALKNATINSVTQEDPNFEHASFLNLIEILTPLHIRALKHFYQRQGTGSVIRSYYDLTTQYDYEKNFDIDKEQLPSLLIDLENRHLIKKSYSHYGSSQNDDLPPEPRFVTKITKLGLRFYNFISK